MNALLAGIVWATGTVAPLFPVALSPVSVPPVAAVRSLAMPLAVRPAQAALTLPDAAEAAAADTAAAEEAFVGMVNAERAGRGLSTLTLDPMLSATARGHSQEMCRRDYFDHVSPTPGVGSPMERYLASARQLGLPQPSYLLVGENIYYCSVFNDIYNVDYAHRALMASPGHRANILEPRFAKIGVGVYRNAKGEFWVTEMFSRDRNP